MRPYLLAASFLPYALSVTGQSQFHANAGVPACLAAAREQLARQRAVIERSCLRDGGVLLEGPVQETLVQGLHCSAVLPLTCELPGRRARPRAEEAAPKA